MNSRTLPCLCKLLACVIVLAAGAFAAQDRIVEPLNNNQVTSVPGTAHPLAKPEYDQGPVEGSMKLSGLSMHFAPSAAQQAELDELLKEQQTPGSPNYHHWLTQQEYADRFGMSQADINKVAAWLTTQGFTVIDVANSRNTIRFSGTAALVQKAFHTQLHRYLIKGEMHFANPTNVQLPSAFASTVSHIGGLNDFRPKPHIRRAPRAISTKPEFTSGQTGNTYVAPGDFAVIYDVTPLYNAGYTGTGMQIAVVGQTAIYPADLSAFRSAAGLSAANFNPVCIEGTSSQYCSGSNQYSQNDMDEADLDVEWSGAVAQNATINFIYAGGQDPNVGAFDALQYAIQTYTAPATGKPVPIVSISYGNCEAALGTSNLTSLQQLVQQANSQGQTVIAAAGDQGATDCEDPTATVAVNGLAVDAPGSIPEVTSMGGSEFYGDVSSPSTYWSSNGSNDVITSALSYIPEEAWNDTAEELANGGALSAGGGGVSIQFPQPSWQDWVTPTGFSGTPMRFVPDMSLNASPDHDGYLICSQVYGGSNNNTPEGTSCTNGFRYSDGSLNVVGGTSAAAPSFAGILALIEQKAGTSFGNLNQAIYTVAQNSTAYGNTASSPAFHDITMGNNESPCLAGTPDCPNGGQIGYSAGTGYDLATGLGSVDANQLATDLIANESATATTIALALSPSSNITVGQAVTVTATVTPNSGSGTPAGTVNFLLNGSSVASVTLSAAGVAQTTITFASVGNNTLVADFSSNNLAFQSSSVSQSVSVANAAGAASTSTSVTASPSSFTQGTTFTLTATVSSSTSGTISGNVVFSAGSTTLGTVTLSGSPATASLNVSASQSAALAVGTDTITAAYQGSTSFATSSGTTQVTVSAAPSVSLSSTNMTIGSTNNGASGTSTITATSTGGFAGTVDFTNATINVTPNTINATASFASGNSNPNILTVTSGGSQSGILTITLSNSGSVRPSRGHILRRISGATRAANHPLGYGGGALMLTAAGLFAIPRRRRVLACLLTLATIALIAGAAACGGGSSNSGTVAATYQVTIGNIAVTNTSTGAQTTTSTSFMLTVQ
jgi:hypothetical protein